MRSWFWLWASVVLGLLGSVGPSACAKPEASGPATTPVSPGGELLPDDPPQGSGPAAAAPAAPLDDAPTLHALPEPAATTMATLRDEATFGSDDPGFVRWVSDNARLVAVHRFLSGPPSFGHHGEALAHLGDPPTLTLYDTAAGSGDDWDELVAADPAGRFVVLRRAGLLMLVDSLDGSRTDLSAAGADASSDANACLPPRQAAFDSLGRTLTWTRTEPSRVVLRYLASGFQTTAATGDSLLWRAAPSAMPGWVVVREVASDSDGDGSRSFPRQRTSCACRRCGSFAMSHGFHGWGGDAFTSALLGPDEQRIAFEAPVAVVGDAFVELEGGALRRLDGAPMALPEGCDARPVVDGATAIVLDCGGESRLLWPSEERAVALAANIELGRSTRAVVGADGYVWAPVRVRRDGALHVGRLRFADGRLEVGAVAGPLGAGQASGWLLADDERGGTLAFDAVHGRSLRFDVSGERRGLSIVRGDSDIVVLAPNLGAYGVVDERPVHTTPAGCAVLPSGTSERGLEQGPWRLRCPGR